MPSLYEKQNVLCASQDTHTEDQSLSLDTVMKWTIGFSSFFLLDFRKAKDQNSLMVSTIGYWSIAGYILHILLFFHRLPCRPRRLRLPVASLRGLKLACLRETANLTLFNNVMFSILQILPLCHPCMQSEIFFFLLLLIVWTFQALEEGLVLSKRILLCTIQDLTMGKEHIKIS